MSDLNVSSTPSPEFGKDEQPAGGSLWVSIKKAVARLSDWFVIQSVPVKAMVIAMALMIPATGIYSFVLVQKQAAVAEQVRAMTAVTASPPSTRASRWCSAPGRC